MTYAGPFILSCAFLAQAAGSQPGATGGGLGDEHIIWAVVLFGMAVALFFAELFVPSGGIIGIVSALCLIGGIVMLFWIDTTVGLFGAIVSLAALPFAFALALWLWPNTPIGRALTLGGDDDEDNSPYDGQAPTDTATHASDIPVGTVGKTLTELRPVGTCLINGKRHECLSASGVIEPNQPIKVIAADGMQIKVRTVDR